MPIDAICPGCSAKLRIGEEFAGQLARCPRCDTTYTVPERVDEPASALPTAPGEGTNGSVTTGGVANAVGTSDRDEPAAQELQAEEEVVAVTAVAELPPPDGTRWYLRTPEGPIYGPAAEGDLTRWVIEGRVTPDCYISPGDNTWHPAPQLFPELLTPRPAAQVSEKTVETISQRYNQPHRGGLILILGIMGILTTCPIPGVMAWVMGSHDLEEMRGGRMDPRGLSMTQTGRFLGMVFSMVYIVGALIAMLVLVLVVARA